jgi:hypothetical protein
MDKAVQRQAKTQLIRVVDRLAEMRKVSWKVVGDFVKDTVSLETMGTSQLEFLIVSTAVGTGLGNIHLINDLYIMKHITQWHNEGFKIITKALVFVDEIKVEFECIFYEHYYPCVFASDQLVLTRSGLSLVSYGDLQDSHNMNKGIALLQRLSELQNRKDNLIMLYSNIPDDYQARVRNAGIMRRQSSAEQRGYTFNGNSLLIDKEENTCPICYEKQCSNATLECTHKFCVECVAKHIERIGDSHGKCPLCRQPLMLKLVCNE